MYIYFSLLIYHNKHFNMNSTIIVPSETWAK